MTNVGGNAAVAAAAHWIFIYSVCRREGAYFDLCLFLRAAFAEDNHTGMLALAVLDLHPLRIRLIVEHSLRGGKLRTW